MDKPHVFITRRIPDIGLEMLSEHVEIDLWEEELPPAYDVLRERTQRADGLLCLLTDRIDKELIENSARLRVISQYAVGIDNIDIDSATKRKIPVGHTPGVLTDATADFTWALLMSAARRVVEADAFTREGKWKTWGPTILLGMDVARSTLGIIGFGRIGQAVARRAKGFDMRILYYDNKRLPEMEETLGVEYVSLETLIKEADFISLHVPLTPNTYHLIGEKEFSMMKKEAILINTARGSVVDQEALYHALKERKIRGAAIDVTDPEPIPSNSPLLQLPNLIITPHIASASVQSRTQMAVMAAENLIAGLQGKRLPFCANPQVYEK
ncbi:2-hydroxyacid dehydrogenase [Anaerolinea thermophila]|uniref:Glyoxylate reductase n=1 Tax=Anaerolinea thermophila (strain DSM 14523 / JCM 11388 / NBRC 100420 / UNI-1) TaxID=926569 RepID=E8N5L1_ANATU|nr:D-glycerate dehydrogenase [Anaerolinea thermophila]BAJ63725.1 glyoxylate reductase [Anaerolinea thermophila UNI-1]